MQRPMPGLVWQFLQSRNIDSVRDIQSFMKASLNDLKDPMCLKDMGLAVERLMRAYQKKEMLAIYADFDLDGTSGLALLFDGLKALGFRDLIYYQPDRFEDGYGVHNDALKNLASRGVTLLISVDVGITSVKASKYCKELGIDWILTDHHLPSDLKPEVLALINPNQGDCPSGLTYLAGVGVAFYLLLALKRAMYDEGLLTEDVNLKELLDCFTIGTITDMVPLNQENRILVKHGLIQLEKTKRTGLRMLFESLGLLEKPMSVDVVGFKIAPHLNALSRLQSSLRPIDLFLKDQIDVNLIKLVLEINKKRKEFQSFAFDAVMNKNLESVIKRDGFLFSWSDDFHLGVIGLVATQISQTFQVPAFIASRRGSVVKGSARLPSGSSFVLTDILKKAAPILIRFGGHAAAAGFELDIENVNLFNEFLTQYFLTEQNRGIEPVKYYDGEGELSEVNHQLLHWMDKLEPFGSGFTPPIFRIKRAKIEKILPLKGGHLKVKMSDKNFILDGIWFSPKKQVEPFGCVDLFGVPQRNFFAGRETLQFLISDMI